MRIKSVQGFTLLEMCLILCVISILFLLVPNVLRISKVLDFECERIVSIMKGAQALAIKEHRNIDVEVKHNQIIVDDKSFAFHKSVVCDEYTFYFNGRGNINMANTIHCHYYGTQKQIVMNLGNGNIYVKE